MKLKLYIFTIMLLSIATASAQDVSFNTIVENKKIGINELLYIEFKINQDYNDFKAPDFEGFVIHSGPNKSTSASLANGKKTYSKSFKYALTPIKKGEIKIGEAEATFNEKVYKSPLLKITVTDSVATAKPINEIASEKIHLITEVSKNSLYLNEGFNVTHKLYVSQDISVKNWKMLDSPKFINFWSEDMDEKEFKVHEGTYQGEPYRYVILKRTVLYPQKTGKLNIEPLSLNVSSAVPTKRRDIFGRFIPEDVNVIITSKSTTIDVKPLPLQGKPDDFTGAVGIFDFTVKANKGIAPNLPKLFEVIIEVEGIGNVSLFDLPNLNLPNNVKTLYEPENTVSINDISAFKRNAYSIAVPAYNKKYTIAPISFNYFNPKTERYERKTSDEFVIEVISREGEKAQGKISTKKKNH
ncbi:BatD family protein [uncultured Dokdonia sp.]|uniref:BatD family protein n=1 Tax=uncultured Dokdonia sp. TaxID=575653 RepID=UPI002633439B|nr:BatD family protein [uncultured Dokdonia sp.]